VRLSNDRRCVALRARARAQSSARELFLSIIFPPAPPPRIHQIFLKKMEDIFSIRRPSGCPWTTTPSLLGQRWLISLSLSLSLSLSRALFLLFLQTPLRRRVYHQLAQLDYARPSCSPSGNDTCPPPLPPTFSEGEKEGGHKSRGRSGNSGSLAIVTNCEAQ